MVEVVSNLKFQPLLLLSQHSLLGRLYSDKYSYWPTQNFDWTLYHHVVIEKSGSGTFNTGYMMITSGDWRKSLEFLISNFDILSGSLFLIKTSRTLLNSDNSEYENCFRQ